MPAVIRKNITLTLDCAYGLRPPVFLMANWTDLPFEPMLMLSRHDQSAGNHMFELTLEIPSGSWVYRYRLGSEEGGLLICDHQEPMGTKD